MEILKAKEYYEVVANFCKKHELEDLQGDYEVRMVNSKDDYLEITIYKDLED